jgi:large subunit ribosomal protein L25
MQVVANTRSLQGSSASRRLRRDGKVPGIVYGNGAPAMIELDHNNLWHALKKEAFHSSILNLELDGKEEKALLRSFQVHPYKQQILHIDFQRVDPTQKIHVKVPLHFSGQESSPAVKLAGGLVSYVVTEVEVSCLPGSLPEFIAVDLSELQAGHPVHASDLKLPEGVSVLAQDNPVIVTVNVKGGGKEEAKA